MEEDKLVPIYGKINIYELPDRERPKMSFWDIEILNQTFFEENRIKIGSTVKDTEGGQYTVEDISFSFRDQLEENKYGFSMSAVGPTGSDNLTVNIYLTPKNN